MKICIVTTLDVSLDKLFPDFYPSLIQKGHEVVGVCAYGKYMLNVINQGVRVINVSMSRDFTPLRDLKCLFLLFFIFKKEKFELIHFSTPKASLLSAIAGRLVGCPCLLYTMRGLSYTAFSGLKFYIGKFCERIVCHAAHRAIAVSQSIRDKAIKENIILPQKISVLGKGSSKGVDLKRFQLNAMRSRKACKIRSSLGIMNGEVVIGYAGRFSEEKGIIELVEAFKAMRMKRSNIHLMLVGDQDERNPLPIDVLLGIESNRHIHNLPFTDYIEDFIAAMDIFVLPSHREGFGNVLIEASALQKPVVAYDIVGCRNAVMNGVTGLLVKPLEKLSLENAIYDLVKDEKRRVEIGGEGRKWVKENFDSKVVWKMLYEVYDEMLKRNHSN